MHYHRRNSTTFGHLLIALSDVDWHPMDVGVAWYSWDGSHAWGCSFCHECCKRGQLLRGRQSFDNPKSALEVCISRQQSYSPSELEATEGGQVSAVAHRGVQSSSGRNTNASGFSRESPHQKRSGRSPGVRVQTQEGLEVSITHDKNYFYT